MSDDCGHLARRAFNVEGILCLPLGDGAESALPLLVNEDMRLEQMIGQLRRLKDVAIDRAPEAEAAFVAACALAQ
jgi:acetolactate synthase-1/3 small subunit